MRLFCFSGNDDGFQRVYGSGNDSKTRGKRRTGSEVGACAVGGDCVSDCVCAAAGRRVYGSQDGFCHNGDSAGGDYVSDDCVCDESSEKRQRKGKLIKWIRKWVSKEAGNRIRQRECNVREFF